MTPSKKRDYLQPSNYSKVQWLSQKSICIKYNKHKVYKSNVKVMDGHCEIYMTFKIVVWSHKFVKVCLYKAQMRPTRTRTWLFSSFAIQIEHKPECIKPSTAFKVACLFLAVRYKIWSFGIMAQVESDTEIIIVLYLHA